MRTLHGSATAALVVVCSYANASPWVAAPANAKLCGGYIRDDKTGPKADDTTGTIAITRLIRVHAPAKQWDVQLLGPTGSDPVEDIVLVADERPMVLAEGWKLVGYNNARYFWTGWVASDKSCPK